MFDFDLYYNDTEAQATLTVLNDESLKLSGALDNISNCLTALKDGWGQEQSDFLNLKNNFDTCITNYRSLVTLSNNIVNFLNAYGEHVNEISSGRVGE